MSNWIINSYFDDQLKAKFASISRFYFQSKILKFGSTKICIWSWNNKGIIPDINYLEDKATHLTVVLDGFISGFGKYGTVSGDKRKNLKKLIDAYLENGYEFIRELNGSFAILIYNELNDSLEIFTDRTSTRPVWYNDDPINFSAANLPSTLALLRDNIEYDEIGLWSLLATSRHVGERSIFKGIKNLRSGSILSINKNQIKKEKWYQLQYTPNYNLSIDGWSERIASTLIKSANNILNQYNNVNLLLSGGMDSRVAVAAFGGNVKTITLTTRHNYNSRLSELVAAKNGNQHRTMVRDEQWYLRHFRSAAFIAGGNYKFTHAHFTSIFDQDNEYFNETFSHGDLLENFNSHYFKIKLQNQPLIELIKNYNKVYSYSVTDFSSFENLFVDVKGSKMRSMWEDYTISEYENLSSVSDSIEDVFDAFFRWQNQTVCPTYLMLENFRPYTNIVNIMFDNDLLNLILTIPQEIKSESKLHRGILKVLNKKLLLVPDSNYLLPPIVPKFVNNSLMKIRPVIGKYRRKFMGRNVNKPFVYTEGSWDMLHERYRKDENHRDLIKNVLYDKDVLEDSIFNHSYIQKTFNEFLNGNLKKQIEIDMLLSFSLLIKSIKYEKDSLSS